MSFEPNDINNIHHGNYEEFFILYMDNELNEEQKKMVDAFLVVNSDLQGAFDILKSTKLPLEEFSFNKEELLASNMKLSSVDEELLLYVDNELPADKKNILELELTSNKDYKLQYEVLLQAKLDPTEKIVYPNKEQLYHRTEKVVFFQPWIRVAAAVLVITIGGMFYFRNSSSTPAINTKITAGKNPVKQIEPKKNNSLKIPHTTDNSNADEVANTNSSSQNKKNSKPPEEIKQMPEENKIPENIFVFTQPNEFVETQTTDRIKTTNIEGGSGNESDPKTSVSNNLKNDIVKTHSVTSSLLERNTIESPVDHKDGSIADNNNRKGSVKGFLRKATRMIEKRTGFDPTNDDGQLLIGSVAINLK